MSKLSVPLSASQYGHSINLIKKIKLGARWRWAPAVLEPNGKLKDRVQVNGTVEVHPEGSYYLEWREQGQRRCEAVSREHALERARRKAIELEAKRAGLIASAPASPDPEMLQPPVPSIGVHSPTRGHNGAGGRVKTGDAIDHYLDFIKAHRKPRTHITYRFTLDTLLRESYRKPYVEQVTREDILQFMTDCYKRGQGSRTVYDKLVVVLQLFKRYGRTNLIESGDWPDYVETIRPIYEAEELEGLFKAATWKEATLLKFLLTSGFRDQEARYVTWRDVDFRYNVVRVTAKPQWRFTPKNWEERAVPLPAAIIERLRTLKQQRNALPAQLVFPNTMGNPDSEMDMIVKRVAQRAALNCGNCVTKHGNRCIAGPHCMNFFLHKFRHTFATEHLRHGVDIRTLQGWMGHRDIKSTMVYLKGVQSKDAVAKVNAGSLALYAV